MLSRTLPVALVSVMLTGAALASTAKFYGRCDDNGNLQRSDDGGVTYSTIETISAWYQLANVDLSDVDEQTQIKFTCVGGNSANGFLGQVTFEGIDYPTTNPLSDGAWTIASGTDTGIYYLASEGRPPYWDGLDVSMYDSSAYWVDIGNSGTTAFEFDFADLFACTNAGFGLSSAHVCTCSSECSGSFCNTIAFVADRLGDSAPVDDLCFGDSSCCCSCPNCDEYIEP